VHIAKRIPFTPGLQESFVTPRGTFTLRFVETDRNIEATLNEGGRMVGKFFLARTDRIPRPLEKFRITTRTGTVLSFVTTNTVASR
jgi:hypothetical protein